MNIQYQTIKSQNVKINEQTGTIEDWESRFKLIEEVQEINTQAIKQLQDKTQTHGKKLADHKLCISELEEKATIANEQITDLNKNQDEIRVNYNDNNRQFLSNFEDLNQKVKVLTQEIAQYQ